MQVIIISGPSGSGKTTLSKIILKNIKDGIILNTDNYYRNDIISKILSKILTSYFDRKISFNVELFNKDLEFILKNGFSRYSYKYNFKNKSIKKIYKVNRNIRFIIIEGIFGQAKFKTLSENNCILVKLKTNKKTCLKRIVKRDFLERGKRKDHAEKDFIEAWDLFSKNKKKYSSIHYLDTIFLKKKSDIKYLLKKLNNLIK